jgi:hypothetical protein
MRLVAGVTLFFLAIVLACMSGAEAAVTVRIDKSAQRMTVQVDGAPAYDWAISTGRAGYNTPNGTFRPQWLARKWNSRKYNWAPMPHSVFFHGGFAIHGSYETGRLGRPASHGCIRLHPANAAKLFALVQQHGMSATRIVVTGHTPQPVYAAKPSPNRMRAKQAAAAPAAAPREAAPRYVPAGPPVYRYYYYSPSQYDLPGPWYRAM